MAFNSLLFLAFLAGVYAVFRLVPPAARVPILLAASWGFLGWTSPGSALLLLVCSTANFVGAKAIEARGPDESARTRLLRTLVLGQVAALVFCKYSPLRSLVAAIGHFSTSGEWNFAAVAVPLGFSYYLFQGIGYVVDVGWGRPAERSVCRFFLFMSFFPKVLMGPIERAATLLPQIAALPEKRFAYDEFRQALLQFGWGLFKKVVIADRLALYVNEVYRDPSAQTGVVVVAATVFFAFQILADFSGYSDMAIGAARLFHIELTQNFENPYGSPDVQTFWRRWHISFSSWISTFIFTPLRMAFRRWGKVGLVISVLTTFLAVGLWHGNGLNFIIFGLFHGSWMAISILTLKQRETAWRQKGWLGKPWFEAGRVMVTFSILLVSLVFFRAATFEQAMAIFGRLAHPGGFAIGIRKGLIGPELSIAILAIALMFLGERVFHNRERINALLQRPLWIRWTCYLILLLLVLCFGVFRSPEQFIYFKF